MAYFIYKDKKVFYEEFGEGKPLLFLHGNTASSKMFSFIIDLYKEEYKVILIDFLGHGRSDRLDKFPTDLWFDEAQQVISFLEEYDYQEMNIIGSSGGALVAINVALERPDLVNKVVADSFEGEFSLDIFANGVSEEREVSKQNEGAIGFWIYNHGKDWEAVVDNDTNAVIDHHNQIGKFFHKDISELKVPLFLIGTTKDEYCSEIDGIYQELMSKISESQMYLFDEGGHPSILTSAEEFLRLVKEFIGQK